MIASPSGYEVGVNICTRRPRFKPSQKMSGAQESEGCGVSTKTWFKSLCSLWIRGLLCYFCLKGHGFLKGYSWFSNYVIMAHVTRGCFLMGNLDTSPSKGVVSIYCEGVVLGSWLG